MILVPFPFQLMFTLKLQLKTSIIPQEFVSPSEQIGGYGCCIYYEDVDQHNAQVVAVIWQAEAAECGGDDERNRTAEEIDDEAVLAYIGYDAERWQTAADGYEQEDAYGTIEDKDRIVGYAYRCDYQLQVVALLKIFHDADHDEKEDDGRRAVEELELVFVAAVDMAECDEEEQQHGFFPFPVVGYLAVQCVILRTGEQCYTEKKGKDYDEHQQQVGSRES